MNDFTNFSELETADGEVPMLDAEFDAPEKGSLEEAALKIDALMEDGLLEKEEADPGEEVANSFQSDENTAGQDNRAEEDPVFTIEMDGEEKEVTLSELADTWGKFLDTEHEAKAFQDKHVEIEGRFSEMEQGLAEIIPVLQVSFAGDLASLRSPQDLQYLAMTNPAKLAEIDARARTLNAVKAQAEQIENFQRTKMVEVETRELAKLIPDLADPEAGPALRNEIVSYGKAQGFDDERLDLATAAEIAILHKAMKYDSLGKGQQRAARRAKTQRRARPVMSPGHARQSDPKAGYRKAMARLKKTGHVEDAARVIDMIL